MRAVLLALTALVGEVPGGRAIDRTCPAVERALEPAHDEVCLGEQGSNYWLAFAYPRAATRTPTLEAHLRAEHAALDAAGGEWSNFAAYAREHPEQLLFSETVYRVDADLPELLALSRETAEYGGGAHGWSGYGSLLWDKTAGRAIELEDLFSDREAGLAEVARLFCPAFNRTRRLAFARDGSGVADRCPSPPYPATLVQREGGRIERIRFVYPELDGYAGGPYSAEIPISRRLLALIRRQFRPAFARSDAPARACNCRL